MVGHSRKALLVAGGLFSAAILALIDTQPAPRLVGGEQQVNAPAAAKTIPDLVTEVSHGIARVSVVREAKITVAQTKKDVIEFFSETGTGFVIRSVRTGGNDTTDNVEFDLVTNNHVLVQATRTDWSGPQRLVVHLYGVNITKATLLGADFDGDLAVIRVEGQAPKGEGPRALPWADPNSVHIGEPAVAIGYARGIKGRPSVTQGIISAMNRSEPTTGSGQGQYGGLLQTDAAINHGNSGGPLLNMRGEVMGVNTYLVPPTVTKDASGDITVDPTVGIYFSRSSATARPFVEQLVKNGRINRLALGASTFTVVEVFQEFYNWPLGARVSTVNQNSIAEKMGLKTDDIIVAVGSAGQRPTSPDPSQETKISTQGDFNDQLALRYADACVWVRFIRPGAAWHATLVANQTTPVFTDSETFIGYLK